MRNILSGLSKTRRGMAAAPGGDEWETWRNRLIAADVGVAMSENIVQAVRAQVGDAPPRAQDFVAEVQSRLQRLEAMVSIEGRQPFVILVMGINGGGKTTTIAKLAHYYVGRGQKVLLAAGDTFRAAAREQLQTWGERLGGVEVLSEQGDPASLAFNAARAGAARGVDVVMIDTAGRLPTQKHLMAELAKVRAAVGKAMPGAPHELLLVLDATVGQNAIAQMECFIDAVGLTGLLLAKLDGSSKGGFLLSLADVRPLPVRFVGVGEGMDDLIMFDADEYAAALVGVGVEEAAER